MGRWGDSFFDADLPSDVRATWREVFQADGDPDEAATRVRQHYEAVLTDDLDAAVVEVAIAALYRDHGGKRVAIKRRALQAIRRLNSADGEHQVAIEMMQDELASPPKPASDPLYEERSDWEVGDVFAYKPLSGLWVLLRTVSHYALNDLRVPVVELLDWRGPQPPSADALRSLNVRSEPSYRQKFKGSVGLWDRFVFSNKDEDRAFVLAQKSATDRPGPSRLVRVGVLRPSRLKRQGRTNRIVTWRRLDAHVEEVFDEPGRP